MLCRCRCIIWLVRPCLLYTHLMNEWKKILIGLPLHKYTFPKKTILAKVVGLEKKFVIDENLKDDEAVLYVGVKTHADIQEKCKQASVIFGEVTTGLKDMDSNDVLDKLAKGSILLSAGELALKATAISKTSYSKGVFTAAEEYRKKFSFEEELDESAEGNSTSLDKIHQLLVETEGMLKTKQHELKNPSTKVGPEEKQPLVKTDESEGEGTESDGEGTEPEESDDESEDGFAFKYLKPIYKFFKGIVRK